MTPERKAELLALFDELAPPAAPTPSRKPAAPRVVAEAGEIVGDADVPIHPLDPNAGAARDGVVAVRTARIDFAEAVRQFAQRAADRAHRRSLDPMRLGLYGADDDEY